jgi:hypothetical protein
MDLVQKVKELIGLYDDYGSEMPEREINFLRLLVTKATGQGLVLEKLSPDDIDRINFLYDKYSKLEAFDSDETIGREGL